MNYYVDALRNYVNFQGRASRTQFWMYVLCNFIVGVVLNIVIAILPFLNWLLPLYNLAVLLPTLAIGARRLHDANLSGWWLLLLLVPGIGALILILLWVKPGTDPNRFDVAGEDTNTSEAAQ